MKYNAIFIIAIGVMLSLSACKFQNLIKHGSVDEKYEEAVKLYSKKDYPRALQLFDQLSGVMRATEKAQKIAYFYSYCYYNMKDFTLAAYYFKRYSSSYPNSEEAEECMFMSAYCNYLNSPEYTLDQTVTYDALKELQLFTNTYPKSKRVSECNDLIDKLRLKLEMKDFKIAKLFYRMDDYTAAIQMFNNIIKEYPDSPHREEIMYLIIKSYYKFAMESILEKQLDRFTKAITASNEFVAQYPESKLKSEAAGLKERSQKELELYHIKFQKRGNHVPIVIN